MTLESVQSPFFSSSSSIAHGCEGYALCFCGRRVPDEDVEFSRFGLRPKDPNDFTESGSDPNEALLIPVGLDGGMVFEMRSLLESALLGEGWGVMSLSDFFSKLAEYFNDMED